MEIYPGSVREYSRELTPRVIASSLWLRLAAVALFIAAGASFALVIGEATPLAALGLIIGASYVGAHAVRRFRKLIDHDEAAKAIEGTSGLAMPRMKTA